MNFYEAKAQATFNPVKVLPKVFASTDTIFQSRAKQNRSKYNANGTTQIDHTEEALEKRQEDFLA